MSLKVFGLEAFREAIDWGITLAERAEKFLRQSPCWEVITPAQLGIVSFHYVPADRPAAMVVDAINQRLVQAMLTDGFAMPSSTTLRGQAALRLCTINPRTSEMDIQETIQRLERLGNELSLQLNEYEGL
jgi:glutamate/tyrosine decarboxylase-like PLP-dependent enzyme